MVNIQFKEHELLLPFYSNGEQAMSLDAHAHLLFKLFHEFTL